MGEAYTVERLIQEMQFACNILGLAALIIFIALVISCIMIMRSEHRTWEDIRKLEKKMLEKQAESTKSE